MQCSTKAQSPFEEHFSVPRSASEEGKRFKLWVRDLFPWSVEKHFHAQFAAGRHFLRTQSNHFWSVSVRVSVCVCTPTEGGASLCPGSDQRCEGVT